jgi:membrane peptidoglycan carboxypeptidase
MGYTNDIVVGVWVGNADNTAMINTSGLSGAAPIYAEFLTFATERLSGGSPGQFPRPANIFERVICTVSGAEPSGFCPNQRSEFFAGDQPPRPASDDLWKEVLLDTWTGLEASPFCSEFTDEELVINVTDTWAVRWIEREDAGTAWAESVGFEEPFRFIPRRAGEEGDPQPTVWFDSPFDGQEIVTSTVPIIGRVDAPNGIGEFTVDWGEGDDPDDWNRIVRRIRPFPGPEELGVWELDPFTEPGIITLRIFVTGEEDGYAERTIQVRINIPTPTPTPTPTETPTETPTVTPTASPTPTITPSPTPTPPVTPTPTSGIPPTVTPSETGGP